MSKEKPEVGDVFYNEHFQNKFIITHKYKMKDNSVACILFNGIRCWVEFETWINADYKYLGKSKVSVKELFDVEEEN